MVFWCWGRQWETGGQWPAINRPPVPGAGLRCPLLWRGLPSSPHSHPSLGTTADTHHQTRPAITTSRAGAGWRGGVWPVECRGCQVSAGPVPVAAWGRGWQHRHPAWCWLLGSWPGGHSHNTVSPGPGVMLQYKQRLSNVSTINRLLAFGTSDADYCDGW